MSWTPKQFQAKLKGAQHRIIDSYENMAKTAMAHRYAINGKSPKEKNIFDAEKARKKLEKATSDKRDEENRAARYKRSREALKTYQDNFQKKGG